MSGYIILWQIAGESYQRAVFLEEATHSYDEVKEMAAVITQSDEKIISATIYQTRDHYRVLISHRGNVVRDKGAA